MNLVGKIFVVLILVMSVVFMSFAMAVYATHQNWREIVTNDRASPDKPLGLNQVLKNEQERNKALNDQLERLKQQYDAESAAKVNALTQLETELTKLREEAKAMADRQAALEKSERGAVATMNSTQQNATSFRKELEEQRVVVDNSRKDRDSHFKEVVRVTDELNQAANERDLLKKRTAELGKDLAKADEVLKKFGLDKNRNYSDIPPIVDGLITATPGAGLIEISIGSDQGLNKGHKLQVYRILGGQSTYVGRVEVVRTAPDRAVCKIDPKFQNSNMMVGDRVASKID